MTDLVKPFRVMILFGNYQRTDKLIWTADGLADSKILQQELHFLENNKHFILKTDQINLTYLTVLLTWKVERRNLYLQDKNFYLCHVPIKEVHYLHKKSYSRFSWTFPSLTLAGSPLRF